MGWSWRRTSPELLGLLTTPEPSRGQEESRALLRWCSLCTDANTEAAERGLGTQQESEPHGGPWVGGTVRDAEPSDLLATWTQRFPRPQPQAGAHAQAAALVLTPGWELPLLPQPWPDSAQTPQECRGRGPSEDGAPGSRVGRTKEPRVRTPVSLGWATAGRGMPRGSSGGCPLPGCCVTLGMQMPISDFLGCKMEFQSRGAEAEEPARALGLGLLAEGRERRGRPAPPRLLRQPQESP